MDDATTGYPLVSIGIPTHERVGTLSRAVSSALAQTHAPLEVVISDNASRDGTEAFCRATTAADERVRYVRQERNIGPTANFNQLFGACRGEYVLMLADDDWLDPDYVAACLKALRGDAATALAGGRVSYVRHGSVVEEGVRHDHRQNSPSLRVLAYVSAVRDNGIFYGLVPRAALVRAVPLPNVLGNDWLHVARLACQGPVHTVDEVTIHRELDGTSVDIASILSVFGRSQWQARVPQLVIAWELLRDIGWGHPVYQSLGRGRRLALGLAAGATSISWRDLAWHVVTPSVAKLVRRPRGRLIWDLYEAFIDTLRARRSH